MNFLIGDVQGCRDALERLLAEIGFSPSRDHVWLLGDLVNRGPESLATLRRLAGLGASASCLLGNHDLHLLAVASGAQRLRRQDTLDELLSAPDRERLLDWLVQQRMAASADGWLLVHAGVAPQWTGAQTLDLAAEVEAQLRGRHRADFLRAMYGNSPARWKDGLKGTDRLRFVVNALTRIRFCTADGGLDFEVKEGVDRAPAGLVPWFDFPERKTGGTPIAFGHWSTLGLRSTPELLALDTGCIWGGALSAVRIDGGRRDVFQVRCSAAQAPAAVRVRAAAR